MGAGASRNREFNDSSIKKLAEEKLVVDAKFTIKQINALKTVYFRLRDLINEKSVLTTEDFSEILGLGSPEIARLVFNFYKKKDKNLNPTITVPKFDMFEERYNNILVRSGEGLPQFSAFVLTIAHLCTKDPEESINVCFELYSRDGVMYQDQFVEIIKASVTKSSLMPNFPNAKIEKLSNQLFDEYNNDGNLQLDRDEFRALVHNAPGIIDSIQPNIAALNDPDSIN
ncbi:hypothetical protein TVAG_237790 [Trichomonas vaginalis G3]|uniref:EF-hand domain-containing protein n=1 Tax=Trichomonas vaginalis (strain ATCC PRA-98 / G3) TaxID=412133 RepID=A2DCX9_TRIV3|nr:calcineurin B family protein family [Trichomonas vaginalis G3]EAY21753.1 hypothetical protein TVAG_237790 [Trichomonas vaginalis G3]KAI5524272.1 calcineurin B family protein family [Trichomonas vaginalis G3]|eukprot:XP_001582739.1 hypothetical protein [Trichomonas vaginalis G3]